MYISCWCVCVCVRVPLYTSIFQVAVDECRRCLNITSVSVFFSFVQRSTTDGIVILQIPYIPILILAIL